ncbi:MAG: hypothetical protein GY940_40710 [bacterium]|nr:hypothetical protein [bacterium]
MKIKDKLIILFLLSAGLLIATPVRDKTETIGGNTWYTEQTPFNEILNVARKTDKPILAVFSATWCGPCQGVKKTVFKSNDFKRVADKAILLYVEQTTYKGKEFNEKNNVKSFPTFKLFSSQGLMLDTGDPEYTVAGFLDWIKNVKAGNNFHELAKKLETHPNDRALLIEITNKMGLSDAPKMITYLKRAIELNPDVNDPLAHKAYEKLGQVLALTIPHEEKGDRRLEYIKTHRQLFRDIVDAYYPHRLKYSLKGRDGLALIINWLIVDKQYYKALSIFHDYLKENGGRLDVGKDIAMISNAIPAYLETGKIQEARYWLKKVSHLAKFSKTVQVDPLFVPAYLMMYRNFIRHFGEKEQVSEAEQYAGPLYSEMYRLEQPPRARDYAIQEFAAKYGIFAAKALELIDQRLKTAEGKPICQLSVSKAYILARTGKKEAARERLLNLYENTGYFRSLKNKEVSWVLNNIAWAMVKLKMVDRKALEIARKAMILSHSPMVMDTLASAYAQLGNYKEAVKIEIQAAEKTNEDYLKKILMDNIKLWKSKIKENKKK